MSEMSKPKLIALDLDGTLLRANMTISKENEAAVRMAEDAGIQVMLATGRSMTTAKPLIAQLGLTGPQITINGSEIWSNPDTLFRRKIMDTDVIVTLHQIAKTHDTWFWGYALDGVFNYENPPADFYAHTWLKFGYHTEDERVRAEIRESLLEMGEFELTNSTPFNIEVNPQGINKSTALSVVCNQLGIEMNEVVAMGDSLNDYAMLRSVGCGIAMGNAQEELLRVSKYQTATNEQHGVAKAIEKILQGEW